MRPTRTMPETNHNKSPALRPMIRGRDVFTQLPCASKIRPRSTRDHGQSGLWGDVRTIAAWCGRRLSAAKRWQSYMANDIEIVSVQASIVIVRSFIPRTRAFRAFSPRSSARRGLGEARYGAVRDRAYKI